MSYDYDEVDGDHITELVMSDDDYEDLLNDIYEPVVIAGHEYCVGFILRQIDKPAFREGQLMETRFKCGFCDTVYHEEHEAEDCAKECLEARREEEREFFSHKV